MPRHRQRTNLQKRRMRLTHNTWVFNHRILKEPGFPGSFFYSYLTAILICLGLVSSFLGSVMVSTPLSQAAMTFS